MSYAIGLDYGTNSVRCVIVDIADGSEIGTAVCEYETGEAGIIIDPADPINFAPHYRLDPLSFDYDTAEPGTNVLFVATAGDTTVPVGTAVSMGN